MVEHTTTEKDESVMLEIVTQAQKLFQQFGLKKTTMDEIAAACGKAKSTLYHYFKNKEDVFDAVIQMEIVSLRKHVKNSVEEHKGMIDKVMTYALEFYKEIMKRTNLYRIISQERSVGSTARKYFMKMMAFERSYITRILEDGYDAGEYKNVERSDIPWIAETFLAAFYGTVLFVIEKEGFLNEDELVKAVRYFVPKLLV
ncbi:MAG: TetR/AcrR family transcriptional regulator [Mangrovibacterium sp.]|nr:TetR/AcrR family transcriptional regulator [Mangrovibacterium sp.]